MPKYTRFHPKFGLISDDSSVEQIEEALFSSNGPSTRVRFCVQIAVQFCIQFAFKRFRLLIIYHTRITTESEFFFRKNES
jgi:hypothetical protein